MAPVTRSSLHGRSISREGSWQIPTEEDLQPKDDIDESEAASDAESMEAPATEEDQSDEESDGNSQDEQQGMLAEAQARSKTGSDFYAGLGSPIKIPSGDAQNILQPLQQTADRVSRQVEDFARRLDRFHSSSKEVKQTTLWKDALDLADAYGHIAASRKSQTSFTLIQATL